MPKRERKNILNIDSREFVVHLRDYLVRENQNGGPPLHRSQVCSRVAGALGMSKVTVSHITIKNIGKNREES